MKPTSATMSPVAEPHGEACRRHSVAVRGDEVWRICGDQLSVTPVSGDTRVLDGAAVALAGIGDEVWALEARAVRRHRADGTSITVPLAGALTCPPRVAVCRVSAPAMVVQTDANVRIDARGAVALPGSLDAVVPMPDGEIVRSGRCFVYRAAHRELPLPVPADLVAGSMLTGGAALFDGGLAVLETKGRSGTHLLVVDLERLALVARLRVTGVSQIAWAEARGHAVLVRECALTAIDLRGGRHLGTYTAPALVDAVAIDERASSLVAVTAHGIEVIDYRRLVRDTSPRVAEAVAPVAEPVAPVAEPAALVAEPAALVAEPAAPAAEPATLVAEPSAPVAEPAAPLRGLAPEHRASREEPPVFDDAILRAYLEDCFAIVASWCELVAACNAPDQLAAARARERLAAARLERWRGVPTPMALMVAEFELSPLASAILLIAAAPQMWSELAAAYLGLASEPGSALLDERLLARLLEVDRTHRHELTRELDDDAPLLRHGLVELGAGARPFAALSVPRAVTRRLTGDRFDGAHERPAMVPCTRPLEELHVPSAAVATALRELAASPAPARVVVRGIAGAGRRTLAAAIARRAERAIGGVELAAGTTASVVESLRRDLREAHIRGWIPCVSGFDALAAGDGARDEVARVIELHPGPVFLRCAPATTPPVGPGAIVIDLPTPSVNERTAAWTDALVHHGLDGSRARALAEQYPIGAGRIFRIAAGVAHGGGDVAERVDRMLAHERAERLARVANRVERLASWDELVLPDDVLDTIRELVARIQLRATVLDGWGMNRVASTARAVTALFQGGPGTGKTLVAGVIARMLGYELYRVDLSRVTSKWIGETEKNLAEVFDAAEGGRCILLFDEADSLFARRVAVRSSNDRFANLEVNYLLQRLDTFEGVAILTTNAGSAIDPAFKRRLTVHLQFPFPDDGERERLWRAHLPPELPTAGLLELTQLARTYRMSGGYIRNAALRAAYLAAAEGGPLTADHLRRAAVAQYRDHGNLGASGALE